VPPLNHLRHHHNAYHISPRLQSQQTAHVRPEALEDKRWQTEDKRRQTSHCSHAKIPRGVFVCYVQSSAYSRDFPLQPRIVEQHLFLYRVPTHPGTTTRTSFSVDPVHTLTHNRAIRTQCTLPTASSKVVTACARPSLALTSTHISV
jgi:hypothetical protein